MIASHEVRARPAAGGPRPAPRDVFPFDERGALAAAMSALLDALEGQPTSHDAWMLQVATGLAEAAQRLLPFVPATPCGTAASARVCTTASGDADAHARLLRDVRALQSLVDDPRLRLVVSTGAVRRRVLRLTLALGAHAAPA